MKSISDFEIIIDNRISLVFYDDTKANIVIIGGGFSFLPKSYKLSNEDWNAIVENIEIIQGDGSVYDLTN